MDLSHLDGKRIAIVIDRSGAEPVVLRGTSYYESDPEAGNYLRIALPQEEGTPHFLFYESAGKHNFLPDTNHGCNWVIRITNEH